MTDGLYVFVELFAVYSENQETLHGRRSKKCNSRRVQECSVSGAEDFKCIAEMRGSEVSVNFKWVSACTLDRAPPSPLPDSRLMSRLLAFGFHTDIFISCRSIHADSFRVREVDGCIDEKKTAI